MRCSFEHAGLIPTQSRAECNVQERAPRPGALTTLHNSDGESHNGRMTEKEMVLETVRALPDNCSLDEIAERIRFMAAVQKGLDQLDRAESIPHDEIKKQLASWLTS